MFRRTGVSLAFVSLLAGCASGNAAFNSRTGDPASVPIGRVLVYFNVQSPVFTGSLNSGFVSGTKKQLESCGLQVTTLEFDPLELDMKRRFALLLLQTTPDAVLTLGRRGGRVTSGSGGTSGTLNFEAKLAEAKTNKTLWQAGIAYRTLTNNGFTDDSASGERFASQLVARLASDKAISGCPQALVAPKT